MMMTSSRPACLGTAGAVCAEREAEARAELRSISQTNHDTLRLEAQEERSSACAPPVYSRGDEGASPPHPPKAQAEEAQRRSACALTCAPGSVWGGAARAGRGGSGGSSSGAWGEESGGGGTRKVCRCGRQGKWVGGEVGLRK
jgi:hypothetical protein